MDHVALGGLTVSRIGYGCYGLAPGYGANTRGHWVDLIRKARDLGVTLFDTADRYGPAEEVLGEAVAPFRRQVAIATKAGLTEGGRDASPEHLRRACETSLRRLGTDWIDLYQIHFDDPATPVADTVGALEELREQGKIRMYGVGHLPVPRVREYIELGPPATLLFELSAAARLARRDFLPLCRPGGPVGIAFSPTGRGLLTGTAGTGRRFAPGDIRSLDPLFQREKLASGLRIRDRLAGIGQALGKTPAQVAIAWTLAQPGVAAVLTGPSQVDHLEENLGGAGWTFPPQELAGLDRFFAAEDGRLREESVRAARAIVTRPLPREDETPYRDLVYAMETAVEYGLAAEAEVFPLVVRLLGVRKQTKGAYEPSLEEVREALRAMIAP